MSLTKKLAVEFIGTFALIFIGVSSICVNAGLAGVALAHGLTIAVMASAMGHISGGHFNPAVTVGAFIGRKISPKETIAYIIAQLAGGAAGAVAVKSVFPLSMYEVPKLGSTLLAADVSIGAGILMELILTFFLVLVVYGTAIDSRAPKVGGLFIGLTVTLGILAGGPLTGASMNPARSFGPALAGGYWDNHIVYWIGPLLGGIVAGLIYSKYLGKEGM
ncbi:MAG: aquaporin [Ignavibacteriae bacterium]|nr:aquaporin [Ignavibacteriota bacterium]